MTEKTILYSNETGGLGEITILHPSGTFEITSASRIAIQTIVKNQSLLKGRGIDWGCGTGCLAITAAKIDAVDWIIGLDISKKNIEIAKKNSIINGVENKTEYVVSDSYNPVIKVDKELLERHRGKYHFILANPPSSENDDGFEYRRIVLRGATEYLQTGGKIFLNISSQYAMERIEQLSKEINGISYEGLLESSELLPFDLRRPDLLVCLKQYAKEENRGGKKYLFYDTKDSGVTIDARKALKRFRERGLMPFTRWQTHLFIHS
jgi:tRNA1(Val) A37 N6-methylase TrmN6